MYFASDTGAGAAPQVLAGIMQANDGFAPSYGADPLTAQAIARIRALFEAPEAEVFFVTSGTAANALALATICPPWASVFCHADAHIQHDECGAPEFYTHGAKLVPVPGPDGRIAPAALQAALARAGTDPVHVLQRGALSLSNVTEAGTLLTPEETRKLSDIAKAYGLPVHLDGARFANAVAATGAAPADLTWRAGVDILSFGGTKGGCLGVEAVVLFTPERAGELQLRRKRGGHLLAKHRFLAAQMLAWTEGSLWLDLARHANRMAETLANGLSSLPGVSLSYPAQANILFAEWPKGTSARLRAAGAMFYDAPAPEGREGARLVASWSTTKDDVARFLAAFG